MYNKNLALESQPQVQAPPFIDLSLPSDHNDAWQLSPRKQRLQDQLHHERQQFEAWKLEMHNDNLALGSQPQVQAPPFIGSSRPSNVNNAPGDAVNKSGRSVRGVDVST